MTISACVVYHSGYGHTAKQAEAILEGMKGVDGVEASLVSVDDLGDDHPGACRVAEVDAARPLWLAGRWRPVQSGVEVGDQRSDPLRTRGQGAERGAILAEVAPVGARRQTEEGHDTQTGGLSAEDPDREPPRGVAQRESGVDRDAGALGARLLEHGFELVSGGTDNHLVLVDLRNSHEDLSGKDAEEALEASGITVNKNTVPGESRSPFVTSGLRIGTPALTTRGMNEGEMHLIGNWIAEILAAPGDDTVQRRVRAEVSELCARFPLYPELARS